ncbi:CvpA family protein [Alistipes sp. CAG:268]|uniref:CvpA family protein n=1 Tax=Alistipes sp. CAG:268 TaxID=1262693 RepID=UPI0025C283ED|nr:CvpA family protein [Alistipes sp. CAG:268]
MNSIDLIVCLILLLAVWNGWRQGLVVQVCSLAGIVIAIWLAAHYGARVGEWLRLDESFSAAGGFVGGLVGLVVWGGGWSLWCWSSRSSGVCCAGCSASRGSVWSIRCWAWSWPC